MDENDSSQAPVNINPWGRTLNITARMLEDVFAESEALQRLSRIGPDKTDAEEKAECVQELFLGLVKKVHEDPRERNVYLCPGHKDRVMVYDGASWTELPLMDAISSLFDRVSDELSKNLQMPVKEDNDPPQRMRQLYEEASRVRLISANQQGRKEGGPKTKTRP